VRPTVSSQFEGLGVSPNPGYSVVNATVAYRLPWRAGPLAGVTVHVKVTNLLNADYSEVKGFPALGRYVVAGVRAEF